MGGGGVKHTRMILTLSLTLFLTLSIAIPSVGPTRMWQPDPAATHADPDPADTSV